MRVRTSLTAQAIVLSYIVTLVGLAVHEVAHLVILHAMGGGGYLLVVPWRLAISNFVIYGLHVEPSPPLSTQGQVFLNASGPILAMGPFAMMLYYARERLLRAAMVSNLIILGFFAVLESSYELLETLPSREVGLLGSPEFNIGVPIIIILAVAYRMVWKAT